MRLELTILTATLVLAPIVSGYSCYDQGGSKSCDSKDDLHKYREDYCGSDRWKTGGSYSKGRSKINVSGHYHDQKSCYDRFQGVIDECYGKKNGGRPWRARHHPHTSRAAFALRVPIHCGTVLTTCTSLHIYIDEAIRVIAPVGGVPSREVRRDKCTVDGEALPVGINIEMVIYSICRRARYSERFHRFARRNGGYHAGRETSANRTGYSASM
ncbi:hypothetical protein BFW01_g10387 [Lasiodiplodia theobromae]|uniref:Secreted protein n=1 Tax=Lasiodiplodia theobromae TaxID=45133 RepID=A0A8H7MA80_9PEZI|nr:hypothetical protein BFW01_g10387 [Lasiodiplodia theobromae]